MSVCLGHLTFLLQRVLMYPLKASTVHNRFFFFFFLLTLDPENARTSLLINMRALVPTIFEIMLDAL